MIFFQFFQQLTLRACNLCCNNCISAQANSKVLDCENQLHKVQYHYKLTFVCHQSFHDNSKGREKVLIGVIIIVEWLFYRNFQEVWLGI